MSELPVESEPILKLKYALFQNYCTSFYGSQILPLFGNCMEDIYTAWRIATCRVWRVPWITHHMLPHLAGMIDRPRIVVCQKVYQIYKCVYEI